MANLKVKDKKIIPEFVGSLMRAIARGGAKKTIKTLQKDPTIRKSISKIQQIDRELKDYIEKESERNPEFKQAYDYFDKRY